MQKMEQYITLKKSILLANIKVKDLWNAVSDVLNG